MISFSLHLEIKYNLFEEEKRLSEWAEILLGFLLFVFLLLCETEKLLNVLLVVTEIQKTTKNYRKRQIYSESHNKITT